LTAIVIATPQPVYPVSERFVGIARETVYGTAVNPTVTIPLTSFLPVDKPVWIMDEAWRGSMAGEYDMLQGPLWAETAFAGPVYGDTIGHLLYNILGDYTQSATSTTPTSTLSAAVAAGVSTIPVASGGASFTSGMYAEIYQTGSTGPAEIVLITSGSTGTTVALSATTPTRFAHSSAAVITNTTVTGATYTNTFTLLNSTVGTGGNQQSGQPPSHTFTDRTQVPGTAGNLAAQYAFGCVSALTLTGSAQGIFMMSGNMTSFAYAQPSAAPTANVSGVRATPNWHSTVGINGTVSGAPVNDLAEWEFALNRVVDPLPTTDGTQSPYTIARGKFTATAKLTFQPSVDLTALTYMLNNTQPQLQIVYSNGLAGASNITYTINVQLGAFDTANINESSALFGYDVTAKLIANTTNAIGWSGLYSPISIAVNNSIPVY
jgi:hypothetical protein